MILNFSVFLTNRNGAPIVSESIPAVNFGNITLAAFIHVDPSSGVKGRRIVTKDICAICYETEEIVQIDEIRKKRDVGGKNPL